MLATPALAAVGRRIGARLAARRDSARHGAGPASAELAGHVVIGGFGRVGRAVARLLDATGIAYVALDLNADAGGQGAGPGQAGLLRRCQPVRDPAPGRRRGGAGLRGDAGRAGRGGAHGAGDPHGLAECRHLRPGARRRPRPTADGGGGEQRGAGGAGGQPAARRPGAGRHRPAGRCHRHLSGGAARRRDPRGWSTDPRAAGPAGCG